MWLCYCSHCSIGAGVKTVGAIAAQESRVTSAADPVPKDACSHEAQQLEHCDAPNFSFESPFFRDKTGPSAA